MAAARRLARSFFLLRSSSRVLFSSESAVHKTGRTWRKFVFKGVASLAVAGGLCAVPFRQVEDLSHDSLIRRAASLATDSSSTFLSQTTLALIDAITEYSKAVHTLISLQKRYLDSLGRLSPADEDTIWQVIISQRSQISDRREECQRFESTWVTAIKLCETAAEAAYISGAEHASVTARTNIQLALTQVEEAQKISADSDRKLRESKVMEVERAVQREEEEEVPEAYLRED